jgi:CRISPR/Cas system-associated exonuclease Cas4 (RecB family)
MDHLSSSQITLYLQCGLKYKYQYLDNLPRTFRPAALAFGSALHSALAWLSEEHMKGNGVSVDLLYKIFDADWFAQKLDLEIRFKDGEQEVEFAVIGKEMLSLYAREPAKKPLGAEIPFTVPLVDHTTGETLEVNLEGFFDLIEADGTIVEFKTSAAALNSSDIDSRLQFTAYSYAYELLHRKPPQSIKIVNFIKSKKPRIAIVETKRTKDDYLGFFSVAKGVLKGIKSEVFFPRPGFWCKDCEYASICPLWKKTLSPTPELKVVQA